jgi:hypothetical protein
LRLLFRVIKFALSARFKVRRPLAQCCVATLEEKPQFALQNDSAVKQWKRGVLHSEASLAMKEPFMMAFLTVSTIAGMIFGLYFSVFVLVPVLFFEAAAIILFGFFAGAEFEAILLTVVAAISSLELGYFGGCLVQAVTEHDPVTSQQARR